MTAAKPTGGLARSLFRFRNASALAISMIVLAALPTLYFTGASPRNSAEQFPAYSFRTSEPTDTTASIERNGFENVPDPLKHYFGIEVTGHTIGYVVDGDASMAGYIDQVAFLTNSVNASFPPGTRRFGIAQAVAVSDTTIVEVAEPTSDLEGAKSLLLARLPMGRTDLNMALDATAKWYPDQVFMVLAKPLSQRRIDVLKQSALETGAVVNVIALGNAANQGDLSAISRATGGEFVSVADQALEKLVERQKSAAKAEGLLASL